MRDLNQIKEKIEIRLEPQQIIMLALGVLIFSAGLFAAGYVIGQRAMPTVAPMVAQLDQIDAAAASAATPPPVEAAPAAALGEVEFLFPSALGSRPARRAAKPKPVVAPKALTVAKDTSKPEKKKAAPKKVKLSPPVAVKAPERPTAPKKVPKKVELKPAPKPIAAPPRQMVDEDAPKDEDSPRQVAKKEVRGSSARGSRFTLQVKAARDKSEADAFVASLRRSGFDPHVILATVPGKGRFYRIRLGRFATMEAARRFQRRYKTKSGQPDGGFVTEL